MPSITYCQPLYSRREQKVAANEPHLVRGEACPLLFSKRQNGAQKQFIYGAQ